MKKSVDSVSDSHRSSSVSIHEVVIMKDYSTKVIFLVLHKPVLGGAFKIEPMNLFFIFRLNSKV